jgi:PAS domain S-box-containing protein
MVYRALEFLTVTSILVRIVAAVWCALLWPRVRDARVLWLFAVLMCLIIRQALALNSLIAEGPSKTSLTDLYAEAFAMGTSLLCLGAVWATFRMFLDRDRAAALLRERGQGVQQEYDELRAVYDNVPIGMCMVDSGLRFTAINERLARINGATVERHIGRTIREVLPHLADHLEPIYRRVFSTGQASVDQQFHGIPSAESNLPRDWSVTHYPVRDDSGRVVAVGCTVTDVTDRNRVERELRSTDQMQRALLKAIPDAMFRMRGDGTYLAYSAPDESRLLVPPTEFIGRKVFDVLSGPLADSCMNAVRAALSTGAMQTYEYTYDRGATTNYWEVRVVVAGPGRGAAAGAQYQRAETGRRSPAGQPGGTGAGTGGGARGELGCGAGDNGATVVVAGNVQDFRRRSARV